MHSFEFEHDLRASPCGETFGLRCTRTRRFRAVGPATYEHPSVIFILADDMGWANIGWHNPYVITPQLNALAAAGVTLDHY
mgnify:CR=1 FL=1